MASKRRLKKLVKMYSKSADSWLNFRIKDESEEQGNYCLWYVRTIKFSRFCMIDVYNNTPLTAVPYWKVAKPSIEELIF